MRFDPITGKASQITGPDDSPLNAPKGVYVDEHGDLFVADTGNQRVAHLDSLGTLVKEFTKPESALLDSEEVFAPDKIYVNEISALLDIAVIRYSVVERRYLHAAIADNKTSAIQILSLIHI